MAVKKHRVTAQWSSSWPALDLAPVAPRPAGAGAPELSTALQVRFVLQASLSSLLQYLSKFLI